MSGPRLSPAVNGTEQRLDALLGELRGLRADLASARVPRSASAQVHVTGDQLVALQEPYVARMADPEAGDEPALIEANVDDVTPEPSPNMSQSEPDAPSETESPKTTPKTRSRKAKSE